MLGVHCACVCSPMHFFCKCVSVCVPQRHFLSYALLSAMSVISSENPCDMAWAAFQGYSFGLLNSRSLSAPVILMFASLNIVAFTLILL